MSWQEYVDTSLVGTGNVDRAAIFNVEGTSVWAASQNFQISLQEIKEVVDSFGDKGDPKKVQSCGFYIANQRYVTIKAEDRSLYGKKGKEGVVVVKTQKAILVAHYPESIQPGQAATTVEQLGDYLISAGY